MGSQDVIVKRAERRRVNEGRCILVMKCVWMFILDAVKFTLVCVTPGKHLSAVFTQRNLTNNSSKQKRGGI